MSTGAQPLLTVVCTAFNHAAYIRGTLDGFVQQRRNFPMEVIVHDDASTDGTSDIVREYADRYPDLIVPLIQPENVYSKGGRPWFICFERARGKYIAICEGDDVWTDPDKAQKQVDDFETHPDRMLSFHDVGVIDETGRFGHVQRYSDFDWNIMDPKRSDYDLHDLIRATLCPTCSVMFRKPEPFSVPGWMLTLPFADQPLFIWMARNGTIRFHQGEMASYRRHTASSSRTTAGTDRFTVGFIRMYLHLLRELDPGYHATIKEALKRKVEALFSQSSLDADLTGQVERAVPGTLSSARWKGRWKRLRGYLRA